MKSKIKWLPVFGSNGIQVGELKYADIPYSRSIYFQHMVVKVGENNVVLRVERWKMGKTRNRVCLFVSGKSFSALLRSPLFRIWSSLSPYRCR